MTRSHPLSNQSELPSSDPSSNPSDTPSSDPTEGLTADSSLPASPGTQMAKRKAKAAVIITAARDFINQRNNLRSTYGLLPKILARYSSFDIGRQQLRIAVKKIDEDSLLPSQLFLSDSNMSSPISLLTGDSDSSTTATRSTGGRPLGATRSTGGRPFGSTRSARDLKSKQQTDMIEAASQRILDAQKIDRAQKAQHRVRLKRNSVKTIYRDLEVENELEEGYFDDHVEAIKSRVYRGKKASGLGNSQTSPLSELEPLLVDYCIKLSEIGQPLTKTHVMALIASMIDDQELEKKVIAWKKKHSSYKEGQPLVGVGWYRRFVRRNDDKLRRTKALVRDINRQTWVMYDNFESMYECVYDRMVHAGIAKRLPEKVWRDREGLIVDSEENAFGKATEYEITHPHMLLTVDETGSNTNQKLDGHVGGELFLVGANQKEVGTLGSLTSISR
jgi:hypothetical protein